MKRFRWARLFAGVVSLLLISAPVAALAQAGASWSPKGLMPYERAEIAIAGVNGKLYVISGQSRGVEANAFNQEYDPATGTWRELAVMPSVASHAGAAALNGKIYVVGGFVANVHVGAVNRVFEYDLATDRWRALAPLAASRGAPGVVAVNGKIHAIGGRDAARKTVTTHEVYDPATNTWSMAAPLPLARDHLGIAVVTGRIHVFGGRTNATVDNTVRHDVYNPATNSWSPAAPLITARSAGVAFHLNGRIVYAGGECKDPQASVTFSEVEAYPALFVKAALSLICVCCDSGYVAAGFDAARCALLRANPERRPASRPKSKPEGRIMQGFMNNPGYDPRTDQWIALPPLPAGRHAAAAVAIGEQAYIIGGNLGCGGNRPSKEVLTFRLP